MLESDHRDFTRAALMTPRAAREVAHFPDTGMATASYKFF
jgi:hypothetical protein